jgi:asparagine synthase (glutamine-hydrolysing)
MPRLWATVDRLELLAGEPGFGSGPVRVGDTAAIGEVTLHNGRELRGALEAAADPAPVRCDDVELLVRVWLRLGAAGLRRADGMFVLAVADGADLVLIRDHAGTRTVYFAHAADAGWAASTSLLALRRWPPLATGLNLPAVR